MMASPLPGRELFYPTAARVKSDEGCAMPVTLDSMKKGSRGRVVEVAGGRGVMTKLSAQGIVPGKVIEKVGHLRGGPVLLRVGRCEVAIGLGLARKVYVEVTDA